MFSGHPSFVCMGFYHPLVSLACNTGHPSVLLSFAGSTKVPERKLGSNGTHLPLFASPSLRSLLGSYSHFLFFFHFISFLHSNRVGENFLTAGEKTMARVRGAQGRTTPIGGSGGRGQGRARLHRRGWGGSSRVGPVLLTLPCLLPQGGRHSGLLNTIQ